MKPISFIAVFLLLLTNPGLAQMASPPAMAVPSTGATAVNPAFGVLPGRWVRVQGGYVITINSVDAEGHIDASYANPRPLPFHKAFVTRNGSSLELIFELRAPGYDGSTYTLRYDAANDRLTGVFDQVVARQKFDVVFVRGKS